MISIKDFVRKYFNLSAMTQIKIVNGDVVVHGIRLATLSKREDAILLTLTGSAEVISLKSYSNLTY